MAVKLGEYVLEKRIGKGGMGQVFLAKQESLDRLVAVKVLPKELAKDDTFRARFEREAKSAASLIHPNVIQIYSFGIEKGIPYFAMEFVEGEDLSVKLKRGDTFDMQTSVQIVRDTAKALECAHRKNMVHRDIKPSNMMITPEGSVKVMDFGLAKAAKVRTSITQTGLIMGTPPYMSPEQGKGDELDVRSDLYSLGIVFYELLTGTVPFHADTPTAVIYQHIYETPRSLRDINPDIPAALEAIVLKMLEKKPENRYADPSALLADLDAYETGVAVTATIGGALKPSQYPETLEVDAAPTPPTRAMEIPGGEPATSKALFVGISCGVITVVVLIILLVTVWSGEPKSPDVAGKPDTPPGTSPGTQQPGNAPGGPEEGKEGHLTLSSLRAALPDDIRTVYIRKADEGREKARGLPFEDVVVPEGNYILSFERRGYLRREQKVEVTEKETSPPLDEVRIEFELVPKLAKAYLRGKELVQQEKYSEALPDLRLVEMEIPHYEDIDELIEKCNQNLQRSKDLDKTFHLGMKYYRDQEWEKAVETLSKLPEDYEKSSQAFSVLADAREKLKANQQIEKLLLEAQESLLKGELAHAESAAKGALSIDGTSQAANSVLTQVIRARRLLEETSQAQARKDYESAIKSLKELAALMPQSQEQKDHLDSMERAHRIRLARQAQISSLLDQAEFALNADNPESAISKLNRLLTDLDPDNQKAKVLLQKSHNALTCKIITGRIESFDIYFRQGKSGELANIIDPEQSKLRSEAAKQAGDFFTEPLRVLQASHENLAITVDQDNASVDALFRYEFELTEAKRKVSGTIKRRIKLVKRADTWYIAAIENLD